MSLDSLDLKIHGVGNEIHGSLVNPIMDSGPVVVGEVVGEEDGYGRGGHE